MISDLTNLTLAKKAGFWISIFLSLPFLASAQSKPRLELVPLGHTTYPENTPSLRQQSLDDTLTLPFWDDFSAMFSGTQLTPTLQPDTNLWTVSSRNVRINTGMAINAPTIGVASFDGVDATGRSYSTSNTNSGLSDSLLSKPINLALVPANEREGVFFSFFWQQKGRGEFPDPGDSLRLQFKNNQDQWITQWVKDGGDTLATDKFEQVILQVKDPSFFFPGFQFRFESYNRQSGAFDTWNIDYIYLNKNRAASNTAYPDRAFTILPSSLFKDYTAIPMKIFRAAPETFIDTSSTQFYNLDVQRQAVQFTALVKNKLTGQTIAVLNNETPLSPLPTGFDRRTVTATPLNPALLDLTADSLYLQTEFYLKAADYYLIESINGADTVFNTALDYRTNDTVSTTYMLDENFAYDDGQAEFGVQLNQKNGKLAYAFYSPARSLLTHIDVYFPSVNQNQQSAPLKLYVWHFLGNDTLPEAEASVISAGVSTTTEMNKFVSFELDPPVFVKDTFYIGYEQQGANIAIIGFDKNTDSGNKIYFNVSGDWDQNPNLKGSLMLRPRFDKDRVITAVPDLAEKNLLKVYPNPTGGVVTIEGPHDEITVLSALGQVVFHRLYHTTQKSSTFDISPVRAGIYLLKMKHKGKVHTSKLLVY